MEGQKEKKEKKPRVTRSTKSKKIGKIEPAAPNPEKDRVIAAEMAVMPSVGISPPKSDPIPIPQPVEEGEEPERIFWIVLSNARKIGVQGKNKKEAWEKCCEMCKDPTIGGVGVKPISMY